MTQSQVTALLGYQFVSTVSNENLFFVLFVLGLLAIAVGIIALIKFIREKKLADITSTDRFWKELENKAPVLFYHFNTPSVQQYLD